MVRLTVNGDELRFDAEITVRELLEHLRVPPGAVAVEVNETVLPRAAHAEHELADGDRVEVVTFVGGG